MDKPKFEIIKTIDLLEMLYWCDTIRPGLKKRVWNYICDDIKGNDTSQYFNFSSAYNDCDKEILKDYACIRENFPECTDENVLFNICW